MIILFYKGLTRNPEIGNTSVWVLPNICRLGRVIEIPNLSRVSLMKFYWMLENAKATAFTVPEEGGIYQEGTFLDRKNFLQFRKCFLSPRQKLLFFKENPVWLFITGFAGVSIFHHWFLPLFFVCFHCWLHFFMSLTFFAMTAFLLLFCQVLRFGVAVPLVLRIWESFFSVRRFYLTLLPHIYHSSASATDLRGLFYSLVFLTLHSFPTFCINCFYQDFPGNRHFFLEGCMASHRGLKHRAGPSVCLNHTVFSKSYYSVGSIYVLRSYGILYHSLPDFESTL